MRRLIFLVAMCLCIFAQATNPEWALYGVNATRPFKNGRALARKDGQSGFIDSHGKPVIPIQFRSASDFSRNAATVTTVDGRQGIIDTNGKFILEPGNYDISYLEIEPDVKSGYFKVKNKETGKYALSDGQRFLTDFIYDYVDFRRYPFVDLSSRGSSQRGVMNVLTMEYFPKEYAVEYGNLGIKVGNRLFSFDGEPLNVKDYYISSNGSEVFQDKISKLYGIRNSRTGAVLTPAKYKLYQPKIYSMWRNGVVEMYDSISPEMKSVYVVFDENGKEIYRQSQKNITANVESEWVKVYDISNFSDYSKHKYYDFKGNEIKELAGQFWLPVGEGIYRSATNDLLYLRNSNKILNNVSTPQLSDGMITYRNPSNNMYYILNSKTAKIMGPFSQAWRFSEGLAHVEKNGVKNMFIDRNGNEYRYPDNIRINDIMFSEGVIAASDRNGADGYLYNPLGHEGWVYNQTEGQIDSYAMGNLINEARTLFDQKKYAQAMDIYYRLMMLVPDEPASFLNYAACLYNLGYYDQAITAAEVALEHWPDNTDASHLRQISIAAIKEEKARAEQQQNTDAQRSSSSLIWDALGNFANTLMQMSGVQGTPYQSAGFGSYDVDAGSTAGGGNYLTMYRNWERRAEQCYNSLTNLGSSVTSRTGKKSGASGHRVSSGNYVQMKRTFREAQREMRNLRHKANQAGVNIQKSRWEDATVGY
ncbi:MAG: WG repeat-containing protein [Bacteroidales bacterium]|nr:WG repeat-containing protein [Bacteroidales bacterium]